MDLYADLPLAKGAKASSALDADGKLKTALPPTSSMWASAPLMVPQAAKHKANRAMAVATSSTSMLPKALAAGRGKSPTWPTVSLAFKPASVAKRATAGPGFQKQEQVKPRPVGRGLGYVATTEVKVTSVHESKQEEKDVDIAVAETVGGHFFQATYRDEYHPARPNSYEVFCKDRQEKKKLDQVKRELSRRQHEQEREGKLERQQLAKDLAEGRAPAMKLPAPAGRGRGMTMPAWMRKKIEENAASQPESERDVDRGRVLKSAEMPATATEGQFEDAAEPRGGLGFSTKGIGFSSSSGAPSSVPLGGFPLATTAEPRANARSDNSHPQQSHAVALDEFGREIRQEPTRKPEEQRSERNTARRENARTSGTVRVRTEESRGSSDKRRRTSGWDSRSPSMPLSSSRVVLLQNMVGPGQVDDELQDEVKGECSETYGPVIKCVIYEVTGRVPPEEAVRIFVQFRNPGDATRAVAGLNGRFFGGRKVKAAFYDEGKLERMDLTS